MIKFSELVTNIKESVSSSKPEASTAIDETSAVDNGVIEENEVHLEPHGDKGTHYKVVKGVGDHLKAGEVIHDSEVDDLHDMGYKVKHLKPKK